MRTEISSLSIKMSRYFISVPVGPEALTLFNVAPPVLQSHMRPLFSLLPLSLSTLSLPRAGYSLGGVFAPGPTPQWDWLGLEPQVRLSISISGSGDRSRMMLQTLNSGQLHCLLFGVGAKNAAGGGTLTRSQINTQTESLIEGDVLIVWFRVLLHLSGCISQSKEAERIDEEVERFFSTTDAAH